MLQRLWGALSCHGFVGGGSYFLERYSADGVSADVVAVRKGLSRDGLPVVEEKGGYNFASLTCWIDAHEVGVQIDLRSDRPEYGLLFVGDAVRSPGPHLLTQVMGQLVVDLEIDCALLNESGAQETEASDWRKQGRPLLDVVLARLGSDDIADPFLAVVRPELVSWEHESHCRDAGLRVGTLPNGLTMISSVH